MRGIPECPTMFEKLPGVLLTIPLEIIGGDGISINQGFQVSTAGLIAAMPGSDLPPTAAAWLAS